MDLMNKKILVTREATQAIEFNEMIKQASGQVLSAPLIKINPIKVNTLNLSNYNWIFFTSANGVNCFMNQIENISIFNHLKIAVVGNKTEKTLKAHGLKADFVPTVYNAEEMSKEFINTYPTANDLLLVRGNLSRKVLPEFFMNKHIDFEMITVYETVVNKAIKSKLNHIFKTEKVDFITFMSPSTINSFLELLDIKYHEIALGTKVICIGTTTERIALKHGFKNVSIPNHFTAESMFEKMLEIERLKNNE